MNHIKAILSIIDKCFIFSSYNMDKTTESSYLNLNIALAVALAGAGTACHLKVLPGSSKVLPTLIEGFGLSALFAGSGVLINRGQVAGITGVNRGQGHASAIIPSVGLVGLMGSKAVKSGGKPIPIAFTLVGILATTYNTKKYVDGSE